MKQLRVFAFVCPMFFALQASAVTVDFEGLAPSKSYMYFKNGGFSANGFDFKLSDGFAIDSDYWYTPWYASGNGTDWLMHNSPGTMQVTASDGGAFSLLSIDAGQYRKFSRSDDVKVTGYLDDGSTIAQTISSKSQFKTISFDGWSNLTKLNFSGNGYGTYDNFVFGLGSLAAVPVPMSLLLLTTAIGALGFWGKRRG